MLMAKRAGVYAIWAAYGARHDAASYAALVRISHWTRDQVEEEMRLKVEAALIEPDFGKRPFWALLPSACMNVLGRSGAGSFRTTLWIALTTTRRVSGIAGSRF
jgi:hypothetical protein